MDINSDESIKRERLKLVIQPLIFEFLSKEGICDDERIYNSDYFDKWKIFLEIKLKELNINYSDISEDLNFYFRGENNKY